RPEVRRGETGLPAHLELDPPSAAGRRCHAGADRHDDDPQPAPLLLLMGRFDGRLVVVTGAARGQGAAEAALLRREGAEVVACDVADGEGVWHLDVSSAADWAELARSLEGRVVHGLVNNAGIAHRARLDDVTVEGW